jgi:hypothetical protein
MIANWSRNADAARRTLGLKPNRHVHPVAVQVSAIRNRVADVDPNAEANGVIRWYVTVVGWNVPLHPNGALHGTIDTIEHDESSGAPFGLV